MFDPKIAQISFPRICTLCAQHAASRHCVLSFFLFFSFSSCRSSPWSPSCRFQSPSPPDQMFFPSSFHGVCFFCYILDQFVAPSATLFISFWVLCFFSSLLFLVCFSSSLFLDVIRVSKTRRSQSFTLWKVEKIHPLPFSC